MDMTNFLKTVPAVIGLAGLLTYFMREEKPASTVELVNVVRNVQTAFVLLGCAALILLSLWLFFRAEPPDRGAALSLHWITPVASYTGRQARNGQAMPELSGREMACEAGRLGGSVSCAATRLRSRQLNGRHMRSHRAGFGKAGVNSHVCEYTAAGVSSG